MIAGLGAAVLIGLGVFLFSFIGCYLRYPKIKDVKRSWLPSKKAFKRAIGTGFWGMLLVLIPLLLMGNFFEKREIRMREDNHYQNQTTINSVPR